MSRAVNAAVERGENADTAAAVVKVLGTTFEGDLIEEVHMSDAVGEGNPLLDAGLLQRPGFTLRGGTNEVLLGVIASGLGLR